MNAVVRHLSGTPYTIESAGYRASIASVGATLRTLEYNGRPLILGYPVDAVRPGYRGALLAPWPNRVIGGAYRYDGVDYALPLNEPALGNALHGLVMWLDWQATEVTADRVTLATTLQATDAYPFLLDLTVTYAVSADGLSTTLTAHNAGQRTAPYGASTHPYFVAPGAPETWRVSLDAATVLDVDERLAPDATRPADGDYDLRQAPELHGRFIDNAYTDIARTPDGTGVARLTGDGGVGVEIAFGSPFAWAQVYTGALGDADGPSVAIEPMTCPPNAFASGDDLIHLAPAGTVSHHWSIRSIG